MQQYGTGMMRGGVVTDTIELPGEGASAMKVASAVIVAAKDASGAILQMAPFDGVLGLSRRAKKTKSKKKQVSSNFIRAAYEQKALPKAMVALYLGSSNPGEAGGVAVLGGLDKRFFKGKISWTPVLKGTKGGWAIKIDALRVGKKKTNFCGAKGCLGLIDSGAWGLIGSPGLINPIKDAAEIYLKDLPCDMKTPPLHMTLGDATFQLSLTKTANVVHKAHKICEPSIAAQDLPITFKKYKGMPVLMLGDPFLRTFFTVLDNTDVKNPRVGVAYGNSLALKELASESTH
jgi:hypothetical protein